MAAAGTATGDRGVEAGSRLRPLGRGFLVAGIAAALVASAVLVAAPTVRAATRPTVAAIKLGQAKENYFCSAHYQWIQTAAVGVSYAAPAAGKLTKWSTRAGSDAGTMQFEVWHPVGAGNFTLVYISPATALTAGLRTTVTLVPKVAVVAGDLLGYRSVTPVDCARHTANVADTYVYDTSGIVPTVGQTVAFQGGVTGFQFDIAASFR